MKLKLCKKTMGPHLLPNFVLVFHVIHGEVTILNMQPGLMSVTGPYREPNRLLVIHAVSCFELKST